MNERISEGIFGTIQIITSYRVNEKKNLRIREDYWNNLRIYDIKFLLKLHLLQKSLKNLLEKLLEKFLVELIEEVLEEFLEKSQIETLGVNFDKISIS